MAKAKFETDQQYNGNGKLLNDFKSSSNIFYVSRKYLGNGNSTNGGYNLQLSKAEVGSIKNPWPDPWSAKLAASTSIAAGEIQDAVVHILPGQSFTYGDANNSLNGDSIFSGSNTYVDFGVTAETTASANLYIPGMNINYYFSNNSSMKNHCKTYPIPLFNVYGQNSQSFEVNGNGNFYNYYGQSRFGEGAEFLNSNNENAKVFFEANTLNMAQFKVFNLNKIKEFNLKCKTAYMAGSVLLGCMNTTSTASLVANLEVDNIFNGEGYFGDYVDYWYIFTLKNPTLASVNINVGNIFTKESGPILYTNNTVSQNKIKINVGNIYHRISSLGFPGNDLNNCIFGIYDSLSSAGVASEVSNVYDISVGTYDGDEPLLRYAGMNSLSGSKDNVVNIYCGDATTRGPGRDSLNIIGGSGFGGVNPHTSLLNIKGTYRAISGSALNISALPSLVNIDANLISYSGSVITTSVSASTVIFNGTMFPTGSAGLFSGNNKPVLGNAFSYSSTTKTYTKIQTSGSVVTY